MMTFNFSTVVLALVAATSFVSADYVCENQAFFKLDTKKKPSKKSIDSLHTFMLDSFQEAYKNNDDINMLSDKFESVSLLFRLLLGVARTATETACLSNGPIPCFSWAGANS